MKFTRMWYFWFTDMPEKSNSLKCFNEKKVEGEFKNEKHLILVFKNKCLVSA